MEAGGLNFGTAELLALAAALGWASGLRLYAVVFLTGLAGHLGWITLPTGLQLLQQPLLLWGSGVLLVVEFVADKVPLVDSAWDALHTVVRVPAGAALAMGVFGGDQQQWAVLAALLGGTLAATSHVAKASTRAAVNTSPRPRAKLNWRPANAVRLQPHWLSVAARQSPTVCSVASSPTCIALRDRSWMPTASQRRARRSRSPSRIKPCCSTSTLKADSTSPCRNKHITSRFRTSVATS